MRTNFNAATRRNIGLSGAALALCLSLSGQAAAQETEGELVREQNAALGAAPALEQAG